MAALTYDNSARQRQRLGSGLGFAVASAMSFGLSGTLARGLLDTGWSAGAAVTLRVVIATAVLWALAAMVGAATYFVLSASEENGLPPLVLAEGGLVVGSVLLVGAGLVGILPMRFAAAPVRYAGHSMPWWVPVLALGVVTAAVAYVTGIAAIRRLGSRLASFVALTEVLSALVFAWLLLGELPRPVQLAGGALVLV